MHNYQIKKLFINSSFIFLFLVLSGCKNTVENEITVTTTKVIVSTPTPVDISTTATATQVAVQPSNTPTTIPSPTATQGPLAFRIPVIEYHNPSYFGGENVRMTFEWFDEQIDWLGANKFKTLTGVEILGFLEGDYQPQQKSVVLRFDIGVPEYDEYVNIVIPALRRNNLHALFFLIMPSITDDCQHPEDRICWEDLIQWEEEGLITVASHGTNHPDYAEISVYDAKRDANAAKIVIEEKLGHTIDLFAYPFDSIPQNPEAILEPFDYVAGFAGSVENQDRSMVFGSKNYWKIPSYYPYSGDTFYPTITTAWPYTGSTFPEMIYQAIGLSVSELDMVEIAPVNNPTQIASQAPTATIPPDQDDLLQFTLYCKNHDNKYLDIDYLQSVAFSPDLSLDAQALLSSPLLVRPVCNFEENNQPEAIVLHYTGSLASYEASLSHFRDPSSGTSAHYLVERDGTIIQLLPENYVAHHVSCYGNPALNCLPDAPLVYDEHGNYTPPSTRSIGIEIVNAGPLVYPDKTPDTLTDKFETPYEGEVFIFEEFGKYAQFKYEFWEPYTEAQLEALTILINDIQSRWGFNFVIGHYDIQENIDPGPALGEFIESFN